MNVSISEFPVFIVKMGATGSRQGKSMNSINKSVIFN